MERLLGQEKSSRLEKIRQRLNRRLFEENKDLRLREGDIETIAINYLYYVTELMEDGYPMNIFNPVERIEDC